MTLDGRIFLKRLAKVLGWKNVKLEKKPRWYWLENFACGKVNFCFFTRELETFRSKQFIQWTAFPAIPASNHATKSIESSEKQRKERVHREHPRTLTAEKRNWFLKPSAEKQRIAKEHKCISDYVNICKTVCEKSSYFVQYLDHTFVINIEPYLIFFSQLEQESRSETLW